MKVRQHTSRGQAHAECDVCNWMSDAQFIQTHLQEAQILAKKHTKETGHSTTVSSSIWNHYEAIEN